MITSSKTSDPVSSTKMDFNRLPRTTRTEFDEGRLLSLRIDKWFAGQPILVFAMRRLDVFVRFMRKHVE